MKLQFSQRKGSICLHWRTRKKQLKRNYLLACNIWVILLLQLPVSFFDFLGVWINRNSKQLIVILLLCSCSSPFPFVIVTSDHSASLPPPLKAIEQNRSVSDSTYKIQVQSKIKICTKFCIWHHIQNSCTKFQALSKIFLLDHLDMGFFVSKWPCTWEAIGTEIWPTGTTKTDILLWWYFGFFQLPNVEYSEAIFSP